MEKDNNFLTEITASIVKNISVGLKGIMKKKLNEKKKEHARDRDRE